MAYCIRRIFVLFLATFALLYGAKEPSAFETQSGATKKDLSDLNTKSKSNSNRIFELENKIKELDQALEGIKSTHLGQSGNIKNLLDKSVVYDDNYKSSMEKLQKLQEQVDSNSKNIQNMSENLSNIQNSISQIKEMISSIINDNVALSKQGIQSNQNTNDSVFNKDTSKKAEIFKEARKLTYSKKFDDAIDRYNWFVEIGYKRAESYYMLGNIAYEQNRYNDAIAHYKNSANLDDKAKYMPRLLLNSGNSFRVINDVKNARKFYNSLIEFFPDSVEASDASKQLYKLK